MNQEVAMDVGFLQIGLSTQLFTIRRYDVAYNCVLFFSATEPVLVQ